MRKKYYIVYEEYAYNRVKSCEQRKDFSYNINFKMNEGA